MSSTSTAGTEGSSPASSPAMAAPKFGTLVPNRIFVGGISASTSEADLTQLFSAYGNVKAAKIISDRAGVSKGYGFVTFETDEEARRLQQESECIILRERKLNIAPAIKKQPFNRSFDGGSGSPPTVPTGAYYYPNGMGLAYQNGLTIYNTGAAAPGTPIPPPTDSTAIYQAAGVFGAQPTSGHQSFTPMVYSCPGPSLYMPQQYPYSPITYEQYYAGAMSGGGPQPYALYQSSGNASGQHEQQQQQTQQQHQQQQAQSNGTIGGTGRGNSGPRGGSGTNSTSQSTNLATLPPPPPPQGHFYGPSGLHPASHHHHHHQHPSLATGPIQQQPQLDHLYYSIAAPGPPPMTSQPHHHHHHQAIGLGDQQLLVYTPEPPNCQQLVTTPISRTIGPEVQIYGAGSPGQSRYNQQQMSVHQQPQQQQRISQRSFSGIGQSMNSSRKPFGSGSHLGQGSGDQLRRPKSKMSSLSQGGVCKIQDERGSGGGGGDATGSTMVNRLPISPPVTPRNHANADNNTLGSANIIGNNGNPMNDACYQIQTLSL